MKIRTDFVTNSSSASSVDITIDNPVLLEILQRYKDMGVFGNAETKFIIGASGPVTRTAAFRLYEGSGDSSGLRSTSVGSLDEVLGTIIEVMEDDDFVDDPSAYDYELFEQMKEELILRKEGIFKSYISVSWDAADWSWGSEISPGYEKSWSYHYDQINGENYCVERWDEEEDSDEDVED